MIPNGPALYPHFLEVPNNVRAADVHMHDNPGNENVQVSGRVDTSSATAPQGAVGDGCCKKQMMKKEKSLDPLHQDAKVGAEHYESGIYHYHYKLPDQGASHQSQGNSMCGAVFSSLQGCIGNCLGAKGGSLKDKPEPHTPSKGVDIQGEGRNDATGLQHSAEKVLQPSYDPATTTATATSTGAEAPVLAQDGRSHLTGESSKTVPALNQTAAFPTSITTEPENKQIQDAHLEDASAVRSTIPGSVKGDSTAVSPSQAAADSLPEESVKPAGGIMTTVKGRVAQAIAALGGGVGGGTGSSLVGGAKSAVNQGGADGNKSRPAVAVLHADGDSDEEFTCASQRAVDTKREGGRTIEE
ncbi:hypothetical protein CEUSTIGMA_g10152.t1 [Chlamydomonas eustigma]|uniref:Uncharacterized protein n=1 Tax=Chlamydomonas eustigma TaxID=1157962 RepID=A0A250XI91_9CHLO|nr:hypothetical protein CEUSTIGMA_g10152.t1 [Chlamydomonas eustigma]|eukprot:GAX82726.1 hypothetical protein CEUSTIGMA_g10152.t1 [Chlamydomonas eustigma]